MVMQRATNLGNVVGSNLGGNWENVYTNSITAENPYGSINFVDTQAKGLPSAFYRVVSPESAALSGTAAAGSAGTNTDAVSPKQSK